MHERANNASKINDWQFIREVHRQMVRDWFRHLTALQRLAILFVYDRTLGWGKEWERITMDQCSGGIYGSDGQCYAAPFTSCRKRASEVLRSLIDIGLLRVEYRGKDRAGRYAINFNWRIETDGMKLPKRLKDGGENAPLIGAETPLSMGAKTPLLRGGKERVVNNNTTDADRVRGDSRREIEETILQVKFRSRTRAASKKADGRFHRSDASGFVPTRAALAVAWRELWLQHYTDTPLEPLAASSRAILHGYWKSWVESRTTGEFSDYLEWLFTNWNAIRVGTFSWMTSYPKAPAIRMIVSAKLRPYLEEAYREKEAIAIWRKLEPHERKMRELVENGMDPDKAQEVVEREFATKKELAELGQARKRLNIMLETFNRREDVSTRTEKRERKPLASNTNFKQWEDE